MLKEIIQRIDSRFHVDEVTDQRDNLHFITVQKADVISLLTYMRDIEHFTHFVLMTAVDWIENGKFQLTYILNHPDKKVDIGIRTYISRENEPMESAHHLWNHVATYQRELKEMFGINFPGSPRVDESFLLEGWEDTPPMRREFDTKKYSEETYFPRPRPEGEDPKEYMKRKLYPDEEK